MKQFNTDFNGYAKAEVQDYILELMEKIKFLEEKNTILNNQLIMLKKDIRQANSNTEMLEIELNKLKKRELDGK